MPLAVGNCPSNHLQEARRTDRLSHFILRLAFSTNIVIFGKKLRIGFRQNEYIFV